MVKAREEFLGPITQLDEDSSGTVNANDADLQNVQSVLHTARAIVPSTGSNKGVFWVQSGTPTSPKFTDSAGNTITLGGGSSAGGDLSGSFPNPVVIGAHFNGTALLFNSTIPDGYVLKRNSFSITGAEPISIITGVTASGDLSGTYPSPTVTAAHFNSDQLAFNTTIEDGYLLARNGSSVIGIDPFSISLGASAGGDLSGIYPDPSVISAHFNGELLLFDNTIDDGYILIRDGYSVNGSSISNIISEVSAGGDLSGNYPDPSVISAHFNSEQLSFDTTIEDGYILIRDGSSIIGLDPNEIAFAGSAGGDLSGTYPDPDVVSAHFNSEQLLFDTTIEDGYILIRDGSSIIGLNPSEIAFEGSAGGDLSGTYPDPEVISAHFNSEQLLFDSTINNGYILIRSGSSIIGLDYNTIALDGNVTGTINNTVVSTLTFDSDELTLATVDDGYLLIRDGYNISGKSITSLLNEMSLDGYMPFNEELTISSDGQTSFSLLETPFNNEISLFVNGVKQSSSNYTVVGTSLTWTGDVTLETTDELIVSYFKLIINSGGYILEGQTLRTVLNSGNVTGGHDLELSDGDFIISSTGTVNINSDGYIYGSLEVEENITSNTLIIKESSSNPNESMQVGESTLWINNIDKRVHLDKDDGYSILPRKERFSFNLADGYSEYFGNINLSNMTNDSVTWIKVNVLCYRPSNSELGITYADYNLIVRKDYGTTCELIHNDEIFKQGTTEDFSVSISFTDTIANIVITNNEVSDALHFSGYFELGIIE